MTDATGNGSSRAVDPEPVKTSKLATSVPSKLNDKDAKKRQEQVTVLTVKKYYWTDLFT